MSDAVSYLSEPPTAGKVLLHTTVGDLDIELFSSAAPLTCRFFLALCLRRAYEGCIFHRVVRDFLVQTGDLSTASSSSNRAQHAAMFPPSLKPELHSRLKFNRRGLVGLATSASAGSAQNRSSPSELSQFFITLRPAEELSGRHTLFGKVSGDTVYNLQRFNELQLQRQEAGGGPSRAEGRPLQDVRITGVEVLSCPFADLLQELQAEEVAAKAESEKEERRRRAEGGQADRLTKRKVQLLSFGADAAEDEDDTKDAGRKRAKALHDLVKDDSRLVRVQETDAAEADEQTEPRLQRSRGKLATAGDGDERREEQREERPRLQREEEQRQEEERKEADAAQTGGTQPLSSASSSASPSIAQQVSELRQRLLGQARASPSASDTAVTAAPAAPQLSALEKRKQAFMARRPRDAVSTASSSSASSTLAKLARFKQTLQAIPAPSSSSSSTSVKPAVVTAASSLLREDDGEDGSGSADVSWMRHRLRFERRPQDWKKEEDELLVLDPKAVGDRGSISRRGEAGGGERRAGRAEPSSNRRRPEQEEDGLMPVLQAQLDALRSGTAAE